VWRRRTCDCGHSKKGKSIVGTCRLNLGGGKVRRALNACNPERGNENDNCAFGHLRESPRRESILIVRIAHRHRFTPLAARWVRLRLKRIELGSDGGCGVLAGKGQLSGREKRRCRQLRRLVILTSGGPKHLPPHEKSPAFSVKSAGNGERPADGRK